MKWTGKRDRGADNDFARLCYPETADPQVVQSLMKEVIRLLLQPLSPFRPFAAVGGKSPWRNLMHRAFCPFEFHGSGQLVSPEAFGELSGIAWPRRTPATSSLCTPYSHKAHNGKQRRPLY